MAATADPSSDTHPQRGPGDGAVVNSPKLQRGSLHSPWAQVVRGEPESVPAVPHSPSSSSSPRPSPRDSTDFSEWSAPPPPKVSPSAEGRQESCDASGNNNAASPSPRKPAWNKPSKGAVDVSPVMDAVSWPALSDSARASPKSPPDSGKNISDASVTLSQGLVIPHSPQKQSTNSANSTPATNHTVPVRQRSMKRGTGSLNGGPLQNSFAHSRLPPPPPPPPPPFPVFAMPQHNYGKPMPVAPELSKREPPYRGNNWENRTIGGPSHVGNGHPVPRNASKKGSFRTQHHRGDGSHRNSYGNRRDQESGSYEWNSSRGSTVRDVHIQSQRAPHRGFMSPPPPPNPAPFLNLQHGSPMGLTDMSSPIYIVPSLPPESFRGFPFIPHAPPPPTMLFPAPDPSLPTLLVNQIDYYFSDANLIKDEFLKSNMDSMGWVSINLIARFPRVQNLTNSIQLILDSLRNSTVVEVQGYKVRKRNDWKKWIPNYGRFPAESSLQSPGGSSYNTLTESFQKVALGETTVGQNNAMGKVDPNIEEVQIKCSSEPPIGKSMFSNGIVGDQGTCSNQV